MTQVAGGWIYEEFPLYFLFLKPALAFVVTSAIVAVVVKETPLSAGFPIEPELEPATKYYSSRSTSLVDSDEVVQRKIRGSDPSSDSDMKLELELPNSNSHRIHKEPKHSRWSSIRQLMSNPSIIICAVAMSYVITY